MDTNRRAKALFTFQIILSLLISGCKTKEAEFSSLIDYAFDASTIIQEASIPNHGDLFQEFEEDYIREEVNQYTYWSSDQYNQLVPLFFNEVLTDSVANWKISSAAYISACDEVEAGFVNNQFGLFQEKRSFLDVIITERIIMIDPSDEYIEYYDKTYKKFLFGLRSFDLLTKQITPEKALQIAEKNGGASVRKKFNNKCYVGIYSGNNSKNSGWEVNYVDFESSQHVFESSIDYNTGEFKLIYQK